MVLFLLHATNLYSLKLRSVLPESWLSWSDDLMRVVDQSAFWLAIGIAIWAALYTFYEVDKYARDPSVPAKLKEFYRSGERFETITVKSDDEFDAYKTAMHHWYNEVRNWISENLSQAAASLFNNKQNILPISHGHDFNREHMSYINTMQKLRGNLQRLIESDEWDSD